MNVVSTTIRKHNRIRLHKFWMAVKKYFVIPQFPKAKRMFRKMSYFSPSSPTVFTDTKQMEFLHYSWSVVKEYISVCKPCI